MSEQLKQEIAWLEEARRACPRCNAGERPTLFGPEELWMHGASGIRPAGSAGDSTFMEECPAGGIWRKIEIARRGLA